MTLTLVTGATGLVGFNVVRTLVDRGRAVRVLARSVDKARRFMPAGVEIVAGDVTAPDMLDAAFEGCDVAYHAAGLPEQWLPDDRRFDEVNVGGTSNVIEAALRHRVRRFVYTSTIDVFEGHRGEVFDESKVAVEPKGTAYERSKQAADRKVVEALERSQLPAVFLHPAAVYGPGPAGSPGLNKMLADLRDRKVPMLLPGGLPIVFAPDVGEGHVLAEERAEPGDRFILCESFRPVSEIVRLALDALGEQRRLPPMMPSWVAHLTSRATEAWARLSGKPPLLPKGQLHFLGWGGRSQQRQSARTARLAARARRRGPAPHGRHPPRLGTRSPVRRRGPSGVLADVHAATGRSGEAPPNAVVTRRGSSAAESSRPTLVGP